MLPAHKDHLLPDHKKGKSTGAGINNASGGIAEKGHICDWDQFSRGTVIVGN